uniref:Uncharacterized protein n=1 Tax=Solanum lycopersicum TaxID=4081 RepID=A0A3Q7G4M0_SOLLC
MSLISSSINQREGSSPSHPRSSLDDSLPGVANNMLGLDAERILSNSSEEQMDNFGETNSHGHSILAANEHLLVGPNRNTLASSTLSNSNFLPTIPGDGNEVISSLAEGVSEYQPSALLSILPKEPENQSILHRAS